MSLHQTSLFQASKNKEPHWYSQRGGEYFCTVFNVSTLEMEGNLHIIYQQQAEVFSGWKREHASFCSSNLLDQCWQRRCSAQGGSKRDLGKAGGLRGACLSHCWTRHCWRLICSRWLNYSFKKWLCFHQLKCVQPNHKRRYIITTHIPSCTTFSPETGYGLSGR